MSHRRCDRTSPIIQSNWACNSLSVSWCVIVLTSRKRAGFLSAHLLSKPVSRGVEGVAVKHFAHAQCKSATVSEEISARRRPIITNRRARRRRSGHFTAEKLQTRLFGRIGRFLHRMLICLDVLINVRK